MTLVSGRQQQVFERSADGSYVNLNKVRSCSLWMRKDE